jgi:hypothetical protein
MKRCPNCQQTFPDNAPDLCPYDGTLVVNDTAQQQQYYAGAQPPQGWGYPPPSQPDTAYPTSATKLATIALIMGITAVSSLVLAFILGASASNSYYGPNVGMVKFATLLILLMFLTGLTAINVGIVALSMASQDSTRKAKSIVGLCLGILPFLLIIILIMAASGPRLRF